MLDVGDIHGVASFDNHFAPTQWIYERSTEQIHERCDKKRVDFPPARANRLKSAIRKF